MRVIYLYFFSILILSSSLICPNTALSSPLPKHLLKETKARKYKRSIPNETNPRIRMWIHHFSHKDRERFDRYMSRGAHYKTLIQDVLMEHDVPPELYYLAMIESGFARHARSHAQAVGIWQFITPTGRMYGLRIDREVDERRDVIRATRAAARHLRDLYEKFGTWYLAMAAYNAGEARIQRAVRVGRTKNFWALAKRNLIPRETIDYIPKFQAAMQIGKNPKAYGFDHKKLYEYPKVASARVHGRQSLVDLARRRRVSVEELKALNPHLLHDRVPRTRRGYEVWVPKGKQNPR